MDTQQLKQLAGCLRALLEDSAIEIGHGQALDLSASLVGLRNWPEVQAFPGALARRNLICQLQLAWLIGSPTNTSMK